MYIVIRESLVWTNISYGHKQFSACCVVTVYTVNEVMASAQVMSLNTSSSGVQGQPAKSRIIFQAVVSLVTQKKGTVQVWFVLQFVIYQMVKLMRTMSETPAIFTPDYPPINPSPGLRKKGRKSCFFNLWKEINFSSRISTLV